MTSVESVSFHDVYSQLETHRTSDDFHTHVSLVRPHGKFNIDISGIDKFFDTYCDYVACGGRDCGIAERSQQYIPILVDVDISLKPPFGEIKQLYTQDDVDGLIRVYFSAIRELICVDDADLVCFVLEKTPRICDKGNLKNGLHMHFPRIFIDKKYQSIYLVPRVKELLSKTTLFPQVTSHNGSDPGALIDAGYCSAPWLMYGSRKSGNEPYNLSYIVDKNLEKVTLERALHRYNIYNSREDKLDISVKNIPRILSIVPFGRKVYTSIKHTAKSPIVEAYTQSLEKHISKSSAERKTRSVDNVSDIDKARIFVSMLNPSRSRDRSDWMKVGWALHNCSGGSIEGFSIWLEFSRQCADKFDEDVCVYEWERMKVRDEGAHSVTLASLAYLAKNDNPEKYRNYLSEINQKNMIDIFNSVEWNQAGIARYMKHRYGNTIVCASMKPELWYVYRDHRWVQLNDANIIRDKIDEIADELLVYKKQCLISINTMLVEEDETPVFKNDMKKKQGDVEFITKMINNLRTRSFKVNVAKECCDKFYDENFLSMLDNDKYLLCFKNGVYDLRANVLRDGRPEDYISKQSPIEYIEYSNNDPKVCEVYECLRKIFVDKSIYKFFMDTLCEVFVGGNHRKLVLFWTGVGSNGKSVITSFMEHILGNGNYIVKLPASSILGKRVQSNGATPDLIRTGGGVRLLVIQETHKTDVMNVGVFKELSGNDKFYARGLYSIGGEIAPMFKLVVCCNEQPKIPDIDRATINRLCVIPFESKFVCDPPVSEEEQFRQMIFKMDDKFHIERVPQLASAFLYVLMKHRMEYTWTDIPEKVKLATDKYIMKNDYYTQFIDENIIKDKNGTITVKMLYSMFTQWFAEAVKRVGVPDRIDVVEYFDKVWGPSKAGKWKGYRPITAADMYSDDEDGVVESESIGDIL